MVSDLDRDPEPDPEQRRMFVELAEAAKLQTYTVVGVAAEKKSTRPCSLHSASRKKIALETPEWEKNREW